MNPENNVVVLPHWYNFLQGWKHKKQLLLANNRLFLSLNWQTQELSYRFAYSNLWKLVNWLKIYWKVFLSIDKYQEWL